MLWQEPLDSDTAVTLITRPRRFGKTLNLNMIEQFFSLKYAGRGDLDEYGLSDKKTDVRAWYDGFIFGNKKDIYNPWSILNYLKFRKFSCYWANTSSNSLVQHCINLRVICTCLLRHRFVVVSQQCHRIASFLRLALTQNSVTYYFEINAMLY